MDEIRASTSHWNTYLGSEGGLNSTHKRDGDQSRGGQRAGTRTLGKAVRAEDEWWMWWRSSVFRDREKAYLAAGCANANYKDANAPNKSSNDAAMKFLLARGKSHIQVR